MATRNAFLIDWAKGAYGMELGLVPVLEQQTAQVKDDPEFRRGLDQHLQKTRQHVELLRDYLQRKGENPSSIRPIEPITNGYFRPNGGEISPVHQTELIDYVTEAFEVASYQALDSLAHMVGDQEARRVFERILDDEMAITDVLDKRLPAHNGHAKAESGPAQANVKLAREVFHAMNAHDLDRLERHLDANFRVESPGVERAMGRKQNRALLEDGLKAFPDLHFDIQRVISGGDDVVVEWVYTGTHNGPLRTPSGSEIPATGRKARLRGTTLFGIKDGKIVEERDFFDSGELLQQLGVMPGPAQMSPSPSVSTGRSVVHLEIPAANRKSAARFYSELFGWEAEDMGDAMKYTTFKTGNIGGGFAELGTEYRPGDVTFYLDSKDIDGDLRRAERLGAKTIVPRTEIPGMGWYAIFTDPTGNRVGLFSA